MLIGEYHHNLDEKGRLIVPSKFREEIGKDHLLKKMHELLTDSFYRALLYVNLTSRVESIYHLLLLTMQTLKKNVR